jgi:hypothetical protein
MRGDLVCCWAVPLPFGCPADSTGGSDVGRQVESTQRQCHTEMHDRCMTAAEIMA